MNEYLNQLLSWTGTNFSGVFLVFVRVGAMMAVMPAFGERTIPERVRVMLIVCFTAVVFPAIAPQITKNTMSIEAVSLSILPEVIAGLVMGLALRLFIMALQIAGSIIAQSTSLSQIFGGGAVDAQPAMGHILWTAGLALAVMLDLHVHVAGIIIRSYDVFPAGEFLSAEDLLNWGVVNISKAFSAAFSLAAPFVVASLIYNVALGVINRAMPQLMVAFVGAPAITLGGLLLLFVTSPLLLDVWRDGFIGILLDPFGTQ